MTHSELMDNLSYLSALQMISRIVATEMLSEVEAEKVREELKRRFRSTI